MFYGYSTWGHSRYWPSRIDGVSFTQQYNRNGEERECVDSSCESNLGWVGGEGRVRSECVLCSWSWARDLDDMSLKMWIQYIIQCDNSGYFATKN